MKIIKGKMGEVRIQDCLEGMKELEDNSFDLCLTDPPYDLKDQVIAGRKKQCEIYERPENYWEFNKIWWDEASRICKRAIFTPGYTGFREWFKIDDFWYIFWHKPNGRGECFPAKYNAIEPILTWNVNGRKGFRKFESSYIYAFVTSGWAQDIPSLVHPCPKPTKLWLQLLDINPKSVFDPFMGSGTTAEVCEKLNIPYLGFEISDAYIPDIQKRMRRGIRSSRNLEYWIR